MERRLGHLERDSLQAREDTATKKQQWRQFSSAVKNKTTECFCFWVQVPEGRNWKAPKFWDELQYCERHGKMGVRLGTLHRWHRNRTTPTLIIDHEDTSDEELFGAGGQILAPRKHRPAKDGRKRGSTAFRRVRYDSKTYILRPQYTAPHNCVRHSPGSWHSPNSTSTQLEQRSSSARHIGWWLALTCSTLRVGTESLPQLLPKSPVAQVWAYTRSRARGTRKWTRACQECATRDQTALVKFTPTDGLQSQGMSSHVVRVGSEPPQPTPLSDSSKGSRVSLLHSMT
jgi:hypothetical protein